MELLTNDEIRINLLKLKTDPGFQYLIEQVTKWRGQCLNELLKDGDHPMEKGEFKAYGRLINAVDGFVQFLESNPGHTPALDPYENRKEQTQDVGRDGKDVQVRKGQR